MPTRPLPIVGIPACRRIINERVVHTVADKYPSAIIEATGCLPVSIPAETVVTFRLSAPITVTRKGAAE